MAENLSVFGSYGPQAEGRVFGRRNADTAPSPTVRTSTFGKRRSRPGERLSMQRVRLIQLRAQLIEVFQDPAFPEETPDIVLVEAGETPRLLIGRSALVAVDEQTGQLVFIETAGPADTTVITADDDRLIDHILGHFTGHDRSDTPHRTSRAARTLVGQTLHEIERHVILQTLRHCGGNRTRTARMLGVSLRTVRNKLRTYWFESETHDANG
ncbi:hypothetical protein NIM87_04450 [Devosia sp. XJ19-1]|uniref:DNA binding HTH domain-containing protein n=1 Tax=Devosia ureilytica TaxID=2952754 RepID=A0A9Q4ANP0_9HYPH|nr:hypothetical protein [Devosia ureilytica]MCP8886893.1 hypothetical protein [Devosia ureilytica]